MKIALACSAFPPDGANGGTATFYLELSRALASLGHDVLVVTLTQGEERSETVDGVRVERIHFDESQYVNLQTLGFVPFTAWYMSRAVHVQRHASALLEAFEPDVLECHEHGFFGMLLHSQNYPMIVRCLCPAFQSMALNGDEKRFPVDTHLVSALEIAFLQRADALTAPSSNLAGIISAHTGIPIERFEIIKNPLAPGEEVKPSLAESQFPRLAFVGRVERLKGCDLLIEMLPAVLKRFPDASLTLFGQDGLSPGFEMSFREQLRIRANELGCSERVTFAGLIPHDQLSSRVTEADIAIFPSRYDSSPYACLEAMSFGVPIVASDVGGIPEYVEHGVTGLLFQSENAENLAAAVIALCSDSNLRSRIAAAGKESVLTMCSPRSVGTRTLELYERTLHNFRHDGAGRSPGHAADARVIVDLLAAFDDLVEKPYYRQRVDQELQTHMEEVYQEGVTAGFRAGRRSVASDPAGAMLDGLKFLARFYTKK
ncbi:MAG TPA: glycosyltransferase family 1 protein [Candidatus Melainabacteria bacterium]|nr:glycosyltransferase family 1 protein [Candidatus Melainabacteria bacterium]HIN66148.1 glycosyltransferase family 1 protein [Candidatus Obscuribacterales bacterium]